MWFQTAISAVSALFGGFVGGCVVAFRLGSWRQAVEDRLCAAEERLARGDEHVGNVPVLKARLDVVIEELRAIKLELRQDRRQFVSHEECDRRHGDGA